MTDNKNNNSGKAKKLHTAGYQPLQEGYKPKPQSTSSGEIKPPQGGTGETPKNNNSQGQ